MALNKQKIRAAVRELKAHQKSIAKTRDGLYELRSTIDELVYDANDALDDIDSAIEKLSKLQ